MNKFRIAVAFLAACSFVFTGCGQSSSQSANSSPAASSSFKILAGSELKDIMPAVDTYAKQNGISLEVNYSGSLDAVDTLMNTHSYDAVWLSHAKYLQLVPEVKAQIAASEKTMYSQVVLGVKKDKVTALGWDAKAPTWKDISQEITKGRLTFAMTNPSGSNTGFVTLVGLASSFSGKSDALSVSDIPADKLKAFFSGVTLTSGSSGDLAAKFQANPGVADAIINYESVIKSMGPGYVVIKPQDGVVTADYPFMLLKSSGKKDTYDKILAFLRQEQTQKGIVLQTGRNPLTGADDGAVVNELPFPSSLAVVDAILSGYLNEYSKPSVNYFVLDTSGSMRGDRIVALKEAMIGLASSDGTVGGRFSTFRDRETVKLLQFTDILQPVQTFKLTSDQEKNKEVLAAIRSSVNQYQADGGTAIYSALASIYKEAQALAREGKVRVTIELMTDGQNADGMSLNDFQTFIQNAGSPKVPIYGILYGEANVADMQKIAQITEGQFFDARKTALKKVFKQIRAYQ